MILTAILLIALTLQAGAQPVSRTFAGTVKSVDLQAKKMVVQEKDAEISVSLPAERVAFFRRSGREADMQEGRGVEAAGTVSEDKTEVLTRTLVVYTERDRGGNRILRNARADGKLVKEGDDWYVENKEGKIKIVFADKVSRITYEPATLADIAEGARVSCYGSVGDGVATKIGMLSIYK